MRTNGSDTGSYTHLDVYKRQIQSRMEEKMTEDVDTEVSDEEAAQKSMQYVLFSYMTTDESGNSVVLSDEEQEALKQEAQDFADTLNADEARDIETAASNAGLEVQTATFDSESTSPNADLIQAVDCLLYTSSLCHGSGQ